MKKYVVYETDEYADWLKIQTLKSQRQILGRILSIEEDGHFGHHKYLKNIDLWELKFNDGRRIYYVIIPASKMILLFGGNKNGQDKDIKQASKILRKISEIRSR
jgi:putative addiction module killer protein